MMPRNIPLPTEPASPAERRSALVFFGFLLLVLVAVTFPDIERQGLRGILWTVAGGLMILRPPEVRVPRLWLGLAAGFVVLAAAGFLPRGWFQLPAWRVELEALGLNTDSHVFIQPQLAAESLAGFAMTATVGIYLLGHRVGTRLHHRFMLAFALGIGAWTVLALVVHETGTIFGFFPNRNHSATLLAIGAFAALGSLAQAIRFKQGWKIALSVLPQGLCLFTLFAVSESRGGMVVAVTGFLIWIFLTGTRHLSGHAGKAVGLLLIAFVGLFLIMDTAVKTRLTETVERIEASTLPPATDPTAKAPESAKGSNAAKPPEAALTPPVATRTPELSVAESAPAMPELSIDGRIPIYKDTLEMIRHEPWTGVGPGQFARVYPQYRNEFTSNNDARCLHPESDWLQMLAEAGWPATLCLLAGVAVVSAAAIRRAWKSGARPLRMGSVMGALTVCLHGLFDVPGHRVGLAWAALLLMAIALRPPRARDHRAEPLATRWTRLAWRGVGVMPLLAGLVLLQAQLRGTPVLPSATVSRQLEQAVALYKADQAAYDLAVEEKRDYQPAPGEDLLGTALKVVDQALRIAPLDPHLHYTRGALALHFDDKTTIVDEAFAIQRRLEPTQVSLAVKQALVGQLQTPQRVLALWQEAMRRATAEDARLPGSSYGTVNTYQRALQAVGKDAVLADLALVLAGSNPVLLSIWANSSPPAVLLDREMPRLISLIKKPDAQLAMFQAWTRSGTRATALKFAADHPELALPKK